MGEAFVKVDLHGLRREEAVRKIEQAIKAADSTTYQIRLIHGFNRGTSLKSMIYEEYRFDPRVKRVMAGENQGITILVMKELY